MCVCVCARKCLNDSCASISLCSTGRLRFNLLLCCPLCSVFFLLLTFCAFLLSSFLSFPCQLRARNIIPEHSATLDIICNATAVYCSSSPFKHCSIFLSSFSLRAIVHNAILHYISPHHTTPHLISPPFTSLHSTPLHPTPPQTPLMTVSEEGHYPEAEPSPTRTSPPPC